MCVRRAIVWLTVVLAVGPAGAGRAEAQAQAGPANANDRRWHDLRAALPRVTALPAGPATLDAIAQAAAPFLWPTHAEMLHPQGLPVRTPAGENPFSESPADTGRRYYYSIREVAVATKADEALVDPTNWTRPLPQGVTGVKVRYFFYFQRETGAGAHVNDLESAEFYLLTHPDASGAVSVFLWKAFGAAHGLAWSTNSSNLLRAPAMAASRGEGTPFACPQPECPYRPVLFVEEGKHATALDLNRDGHLTPFVDLNKSFREAWGIRDALGYNSRVPPSFASEYFVPRVASSLWAPQSEAAFPQRLDVVPARSTVACGGDPTYLADLHAFQKARGDKVLKLESLVDGKDFCGGPTVTVTTRTPHLGNKEQLQDGFRWGSPETPYGDPGFWNVTHVAYRYDRRSEVSVVVPVALSFPFVGGWLAPKFNIPTDAARDTTVELMAVTSSTKKFGWYGTLGVRPASEREHRAAESEPTGRRVHATFMEAGVKIRSASWQGIMPSLRIGYRARLADKAALGDHRLIVEAGIGVW